MLYIKSGSGYFIPVKGYFTNVFQKDVMFTLVLKEFENERCQAEAQIIANQVSLK